MRRVASCLILFSLLLPLPFASAQFNEQQQEELALLDAAATMLGSADSWIRGQPEAAQQLMSQRDQLLEYVKQKLAQYEGATSGEKFFDERIGNRVKQMQQSLKSWEYVFPNYLEKQPDQLKSELKRHAGAVERFLKAKTPRASSIAYVPGQFADTVDRIAVLASAGYDTSELQQQAEQLAQQLTDAIASIDVADMAKSNSAPRDAYKQDDRQQIEQAVRDAWTKSNDQPVERIVMPKQSWDNTYGADFSAADGTPSVHEVDRMTVYIATKKSDEILTLHPMRLQRMNFKVNGKRLGRETPEAATVISTNAMPFDVLASKIR